MPIRIAILAGTATCHRLDLATNLQAGALAWSIFLSFCSTRPLGSRGSCLHLQLVGIVSNSVKLFVATHRRPRLAMPTTLSRANLLRHVIKQPLFTISTGFTQVSEREKKKKVNRKFSALIGFYFSS